MLKINQYFLIRLLDYVNELGYSAAEVCERSDINYQDLIEFKVANPEDQLEYLWKSSCEITSNHEIGFYLGQKLGFESLGTFGLVLQHVNQIKDVLEMTSNFAPVLNNMFELKIDISKKDVTLTIIPDPIFQSYHPNRLNQVCLMAIGLMIKVFEILTMKKLVFSYVAMPQIVQNRRLTKLNYNKPIAIHLKHYILQFSASDLELPVINANSFLTSHLLEAANREFTLYNKEWTAKVYNYIRINLNQQKPTIDDIAHNLGVSVRSLQRRLREEETTYQHILIQFKTNMAKNLLNQGESAKHISRTLGYDQVSAFYKSFKKWTGKTVKEYLSSQF